MTQWERRFTDRSNKDTNTTRCTAGEREQRGGGGGAKGRKQRERGGEEEDVERDKLFL